MAKGRVISMSGGLADIKARLAALSPAAIKRVQTRTVATLKRRLATESARVISDEILNTSPRNISKYITVGVTDSSISVYASNARLSLSLFQPQWGGRKSAGASAKVYRDEPARIRPHTFFIKGRGKAVYTRVPSAIAARERLPIVLRKGPSVVEAVFKDRGEIVREKLFPIAKTVFAEEIQRLLNVESRR